VSVAVLIAATLAGLVADSSATATTTPSLATTVLVPTKGATLSGTTATLDASASDATSVEFWLLGGSYGYSGKKVGTATATLFGWLSSWNTTTVPNGTYALVSEALNGGRDAYSAGVSITVSNPLATSVLVPTKGATLSGTTATLDASASNATSVEFWLLGGPYGYSGKMVGTATATLFGWLSTWNTTTVPNGTYALVSKALNDGSSAFSAGVSITVANSSAAKDALWFTNSGGDFANGETQPSSIDRITTSGTYVNYTDPSLDDASGITLGPDGAMWFTNTGASGVGGGSIGRISASGTITHYTNATVDGPSDITVGPDGALWFTNFDNNSIGRITTSGAITNYTNDTINGPSGITAGSDGALWFTNYNGGTIGRITTSGTVTSYGGGSFYSPTLITSGPDGALWFTSYYGNYIGRITTSGTLTSYTNSGVSEPDGITTGPDGALWFTNPGGGSIGRVTTSGTFTFYTNADIFGPEGITTGPDGALWFTDGSAIGRVTTSGAFTFYSGPAITGGFAQPDGIAEGP
jgi:virginiamycin B lyase